MKQFMNSPALFAVLLFTILTSSATPQRADEAQTPAVFPPLTAGQQAAKQAIIDSIEVSPAARRPNIVLVFADDLGYADIGCFGSTEIPTPHIDALTSSGMKFTNAYVTAGTCSPSRAALLTGQYQHRFGFEFNTDITAVEQLGRGLDPAQSLLDKIEASVAGLIVKEDDEQVHVLPNPLKPEEVTVLEKDDIEDRRPSNCIIRDRIERPVQ